MFLNVMLLLAVVIMIDLILDYKWDNPHISKYGFSGKTVERLEKINEYYNLGGKVQLDEENRMKLRRYNLMKENDEYNEKNKTTSKK